LADIIDFTTIAIAVIAVIISFIVFYYSRKSEQYRIAFEMISKLENSFNELLKTDLVPDDEKEVGKGYYEPKLSDLQRSQIIQFTTHLDL
jgi:hypothetical protein